MLPQKNFCPIVTTTTYIWILNSRQNEHSYFFSLPISLSLKQFYDYRVQRGLIKLSFLVSFSLKKNCKNYQTFAQNSPVPCQAPNVSGMNKNQTIPKLRIGIFTNFFDKWEKVFLTLISLFFRQKQSWKFWIRSRSNNQFLNWLLDTVKQETPRL